MTNKLTLKGCTVEIQLDHERQSVSVGAFKDGIEIFGSDDMEIETFASTQLLSRLLQKL